MGYIVGAPWGYQQRGWTKPCWKQQPWNGQTALDLCSQKKIMQSVWPRLKPYLDWINSIQTTGERYAGKIISLVGIGVSPDAMGSGIAKDMMDVFVAEATKKNYDYARLSVYVSNARARKFYEKCGLVAGAQSNSRNGLLQETEMRTLTICFPVYNEVKNLLIRWYNRW